ncbi:MAG: ABC transporter ATP-binding protein [Acidimicrobiia bacterium]
MAVLELDNIQRRFGGLPAVDGVTLGFNDGEILAIVGPNGAGKSTLLKTITGIHPATGGMIRFDGVDITRMATHDIRHAGIAMVLQTPRIFASLTVRENVLVGAMFGTSERTSEADARDQADAMLAFVGLEDKADLAIGQLNLHEQRYVDLARALAGGPRLLLLDEVMAGLNDTETQASIEMIRTARDRFGITIIWVEHVMKAVMSLAERVAVLDFGRLLTSGDPKTVMRDPAVVKAYLGDTVLPDA